MKTYQIILKGGRTRYLLADGYKDTGEKLVFHVGNQSRDDFEKDAVLMVDELGETPGLLTTAPIEVMMSVPFQ